VKEGQRGRKHKRGKEKRRKELKYGRWRKEKKRNDSVKESGRQLRERK